MLEVSYSCANRLLLCFLLGTFIMQIPCLRALPKFYGLPRTSIHRGLWEITQHFHTRRPMGEWDPWASSENADVVMTTVSILFVYNPFWEQTPYITEDFLLEQKWCF